MTIRIEKVDDAESLAGALFRRSFGRRSTSELARILRD